MPRLADLLFRVLNPPLPIPRVGRKEPPIYPPTTVEFVTCEGDVPIVRLSDRQFPAVAIQGDHLLMWKQMLDELATRAEAANDPTLAKLARFMQRDIASVFSKYNKACKDNRMGGFKGADEA